MSPLVFAFAFPVGAAAISAWFDARFPRCSPDDMKPILLHTIGAMLALNVTGTAIGLADGSRSRTLVVVLAAALPALVYAFLVGLWTIKLMAGALRGLGR